MTLRAAREMREAREVAAQADAPQLSIVIPLFNEEMNVEPLLAELFEVLRHQGRTFEVIAVDDASRDGTFAALAKIGRREPLLRVIRFRRNRGHTAALAAGIEASGGAVIVPLDGDVKKDPVDIERLLAKLDGQSPDGVPGQLFDVVSGWRKNRRDVEFGRKLPSKIANWLISRISGVRLHDYGCTIKAYRREVLQGVRLYGEMHRFIPIYASWQGARVTEMVVNHRARRAGKSKYGLGRSWKVLLDLLVVKFLANFSTKPIYLFGGFGLIALLFSLASFSWALGYKLIGAKDFVQTPLPLLGVLFALAGVLSVLIGLLAELTIRTYYESQDKRPYLIAQRINALSEGELEPAGSRGDLHEAVE